MPSNYRRFKPEKLSLRRCKDHRGRTRGKNSPEFARRRWSDGELAEKIRSPRAMYWRGRRPAMVQKKKPRSSEHWRRREAERRRRKVSVVRTAEERSRRRARGRRGSGGKKNKLAPLPYLYPRSRGRGHGSSSPLPRQLLGADATWGHDVGWQFC
jgi:hypothetical protein